MNFVDSNNENFILAGLFSQTGANVTGINFSEVGNGPSASPPTPFQCAVQPDISLSNGLVANVSTFSGTLSGNFGVIAFTSTLNDAGTHTAGTYTLTPGAAGNCLGIALTGTFTGDEVPSMSGSWTGTITCTIDCPTGTTTGAIVMTLTQNDTTGAVTGNFTVTGLPGISTGQTLLDSNNLLSGASIQQRFSDDSAAANSGLFVVMVGGPLNSFGTAGVGLDRTFQGNFIVDTIRYSIQMSH